MGEECGIALPVVVAPVNLSDGNPRKLFVRDIFKAAKVDSVHFADGRFIADTEGAHAAVLTEIVVILLGVEQLLGELRFARQQAEALRLHHGRPKARSPADGAIAAIGSLRKIDVCRKLDRATVATAMVCLQHAAPALARSVDMRPKEKLTDEQQCSFCESSERRSLACQASAFCGGEHSAEEYEC